MMVANTKDIGLMANSMGKAFSDIQMERKGKVNGKMVSALLGWMI